MTHRTTGKEKDKPKKKPTPPPTTDPPAGLGSGGVFEKDQFGNLVKTGAGSGTAVGEREATFIKENKVFPGTKEGRENKKEAKARAARFKPEFVRADIALPGKGEEPLKQPLSFDSSPSKGWQNVINVLGIALNPLSQKRIVANIDNQIIALGLEKAANNPFTTALIATGLAGLVKAGVRAFTFKFGTERVLGQTIKISQLGRAAPKTGVAVNTVTKRLTGKLLSNAGFTIAAILWIVKEAAETYPFAEFEIAESMDKLGYARNAATQAGRQDLVEEIDQLQQEILNPQGWEAIIPKIPIANNQRAALKNIQTAELARTIYQEIAEDEKIQIETGETDEAKWARVRSKEVAQDTAAVDYYNEQRKQMITWEREDRAAEKAADRKEEKRARNNDAKFWAAEAAKQRELEAADRKAIADFWIAYRKKALLLQDQNRPSNLNFGLI